MQAEERGNRIAPRGQRELSDQVEAVRSAQHDVPPAGGQDRAGLVLAPRGVTHRLPSHLLPLAGRPRPARAAPPASIVPVSALSQALSVGRPYHDMRGSWPDLLVAAWATVFLGRRSAGHLPHDPLAIRPLLDLRRPEPRG